MLVLELERDAAVLRDPALGDVEVGEDLHARGDRRDRGLGDDRRVAQHAVDAVADAHVAVLRLEVDVGDAAVDRLGDEAVHELDDRGVLARGAEVDRPFLLADVVQRPRVGVRPGRGGVGDLDLLLVVEVEQHGGVLGVLEALEEPLDVLARGHRGAHLVAGHDRDVVDREHVRGVGHRDQQRAFGDERHGHGLVPLDRGRGDQLGRVGVDLVVADRDVVEPEALRDRARELVVGDRALRQQDALRRRSGRVGLLDGVVHDRSLDEPEVDEDVGEHPAGAATPRRGRDAPFRLAGCSPGLCGWIHGLGDVVMASRIAIRGAIMPVQRSNDATPCANNISSPSITRAPCERAASRNRVSPGP